MTRCRFRHREPGVVVCWRCGRSVRTSTPPEAVYATCNAAGIAGLGDAVAVLLAWLGITRVVKAVSPNCGCDDRQERWNAVSMASIKAWRGRRKASSPQP